MNAVSYIYTFCVFNMKFFFQIHITERYNSKVFPKYHSNLHMAGSNDKYSKQQKSVSKLLLFLKNRFPLTAYFCFYNITKLHHNMADHILILTYFWIVSQHKQNKTYKLIIGQSKLVSQQNTYHKHLVSSCDSAMCTDH